MTLFHSRYRHILLWAAILACTLWAPISFAEETAEKSNIITARRNVENYLITPVSFRSMDAFFHTDTVQAAPGAPLPVDLKPLDISVAIAGKNMTLQEALTYTDTNALLVMKDGKIIHEQYLNGSDENSRFISWSMSKSMTSILLGVALEAGHIKSLTDTVGMYVPEAVGTVFEHVTLKNMLQMRAGTSYTEMTTEGIPDVGLLADQSLFREERRFTDLSKVTITRVADQGTVFNYSTLAASFLGRVVEGATGKSLAAYTEEVLWKPAGMQKSGYWLLDGKPGEGQAFAGGGYNAVLRDYARLGQLMLNGGSINGQQIISKNWVQQSTVYTGAEAVIPEENRGYQHQWWTFTNSPVYEAIGIHGQYISVDPTTNTVIVKLSYWPDRGGLDYEIDNLALFNAIRSHLSKTE